MTMAFISCVLRGYPSQPRHFPKSSESTEELTDSVSADPSQQKSMDSAAKTQLCSNFEKHCGENQHLSAAKTKKRPFQKGPSKRLQESLGIYTYINICIIYIIYIITYICVCVYGTSSCHVISGISLCHRFLAGKRMRKQRFLDFIRVVYIRLCIRLYIQLCTLPKKVRYRRLYDQYYRTRR